MRRLSTIASSRATLFMVVPASLFIGFILQLFASVVHAPAGFIAAPLLCRDEVAVETAASSGASRRPEKSSCRADRRTIPPRPASRPMGMPIVQAADRERHHVSDVGCQRPHLLGDAFVLLQLRRRRRRRTGESRRRE